MMIQATNRHTVRDGMFEMRLAQTITIMAEMSFALGSMLCRKPGREADSSAKSSRLATWRKEEATEGTRLACLA